jgi:phenylalanyl-tRNA synthetase beta chain
MRAIFGRLGLKVEGEAGNWRVTPPSYRFDLGLEVDLVEEVARVAGYDRIPSVPPRAIALMHRQAEERRGRDDIKKILVSIGYNEIITYSFISKEQYFDFNIETKEISLLNPIAQQMGVMRGSLLPGLVQTLRHNLNHGQERLRLFELGRCFDGMGETEQPLRLGGLAYGAVRPEQWGETARPVDFFDVKGDLEGLFWPGSPEFRRRPHPALHPGRCAAILDGGEQVGWVGALHPRLMQKYGFQRAPVLFELDWSALESRRLPGYRGVSRFPAVRRDIAVVVDAGLPLGEITAAVRGFLPETVTEFTLFDIYQGDGVEPGKKSLAFRMLLQHTEKTLTDAEIEQLVSRVVAFLSQQFNAVLRG